MIKKRFTFSKVQGFTILEFLVVIAMMAILMSLVLVGLSRARSQSRDQGKVSEIQKITIGLEQYYAICREYPENLTGSESCPALSNQNKTISDILPELATLDINGSGSEYLYAGIDSSCAGFHIGVILEKSAQGFSRSEKNSELVGKCNNSGLSGFDATTNQNIFDIYKLPQ